MSTDENKAVAFKFFERFTASDIEGALDTMTVSAEYHMLLKFREGKITSVREYLDTQHANDVWVAPLTEQESAKIRAASHDHARPAGGYGHTAT